MIDHFTQPIYHELIREDSDISRKVAWMIASGQLQFTPRYSPMMRLIGLGIHEGVRVRDWSGAEGVVPDIKNWRRGAYDYHIVFANEDGETVVLTNGVYDAQII